MKSQKYLHNHTGQMPSDVPSEELKHPPKKSAKKKQSKKSNSNTIAKSPGLGSRNDTGR